MMLNTPSWLKYLYRFVLLVWLGAQWPFLMADADSSLSESRSPWSDEGLYTYQLREWLQHDNWPLEADKGMVGALAEPAWNGAALLLFTVFEHDVLVMRLFGLLFVFLAFWKMGNHRPWLPVAFGLALLGLTQYHVFHYSHIGIPEMAIAASMLLSLYYLFRAQQGSRWRYWVASALFISLCYLLKIQYIYLLGPYAVALMVAVVTSSASVTEGLRKAAAGGLTLAAVLLLFLLLWYFPQLESFELIRKTVSAERFAGDWAETRKWIDYNYHYNFFKPELNAYRIGFWVSLALLPLAFLFRNFRQRYAAVAVFLVLLVATDIHKLALKYYVPPRYLLMTLVAVALLMSVLLSWLWQRWRFMVLPALGVAALFLLINTPFYTDALHRRQYQYRAINAYVNERLDSDDIILGPWGASFNWHSRARVRPVWPGYTYPQPPFQLYQPDLIITDEQKALSDFGGEAMLQRITKTDTFHYHHWTLRLHWVGEQ